MVVGILNSQFAFTIVDNNEVNFARGLKKQVVRTTKQCSTKNVSIDQTIMGKLQSNSDLIVLFLIVLDKFQSVFLKFVCWGYVLLHPWTSWQNLLLMGDGNKKQQA